MQKKENNLISIFEKYQWFFYSLNMTSRQLRHRIVVLGNIKVLEMRLFAEHVQLLNLRKRRKHKHKVEKIKLFCICCLFLSNFCCQSNCLVTVLFVIKKHFYTNKEEQEGK